MGDKVNQSPEKTPRSQEKKLGKYQGVTIHLSFVAKMASNENSQENKTGAADCDKCENFPEEIQALKNKRMFRAAAEGHLGCLNSAIEAAADVNILDEPTGQRKEILDAQDALFSGLIDKHAALWPDIYPEQYERNNPPQKTALIHAAENGNDECVELLINSGAEVDKTDTSARTPLMAAAENGHDRVVELLIKAEADVNDVQWDRDERIDTGFTAVMFAEKNGHKGCVKLLVDAGAEVNKTKKNKKARRY